MSINNDLMSPEEYTSIDKNFVNSFRLTQDVSMDIYDLEGFFMIEGYNDFILVDGNITQEDGFKILLENGYSLIYSDKAYIGDEIIGYNDFILVDSNITQEDGFKILLENGYSLIYSDKEYNPTTVAQNFMDGVLTIVNIK